MIKILEKLLNLIYIKECCFCGSHKEDSLMCSKCRAKIHFLPNDLYKNIRGKEVYVTALYDGVIKELIKQLKYKGKKCLSPVMADLMFEYWTKLDISPNDFIVIPVPIHKLRKEERGYNHMELVVKDFCSLTHYRYNSDFLIRIKDTKKQYNLNKQERINNIKNAFSVNMEKIPDKSSPILIVDDITSTGTTLSEIINLMIINGYNNIKAFTLSTPDIWN